MFLAEVVPPTPASINTAVMIPKNFLDNIFCYAPFIKLHLQNISFVKIV
jgi:hypothetical protein